MLDRSAGDPRLLVSPMRRATPRARQAREADLVRRLGRDGRGDPAALRRGDRAGRARRARALARSGALRRSRWSLLLDQFPRNVWRGTRARVRARSRRRSRPRARRSPRATSTQLAPIEQAFLILPYEHSESLEAQRECVALSEQIHAPRLRSGGRCSNIYADYARRHLALIERFGRFPAPQPGARARIDAGRARLPECGRRESFGQGVR